jgi:hypothetical protein
MTHARSEDAYGGDSLRWSFELGARLRERLETDGVAD